MNENDHCNGDGRCDDAMIWGILHSQTHPYTPKYLWNAIWPIKNQAAHPPISISSNRLFTTLTWNWFSLTNHSTHSNPLFIFVHLCSCGQSGKWKIWRFWSHYCYHQERFGHLCLADQVWSQAPCAHWTNWPSPPGETTTDRRRDWPEICESNDPGVAFWKGNRDF